MGNYHNGPSSNSWFCVDEFEWRLNDRLNDQWENPYVIRETCIEADNLPKGGGSQRTRKECGWAVSSPGVRWVVTPPGDRSLSCSGNRGRSGRSVGSPSPSTSRGSSSAS